MLNFTSLHFATLYGDKGTPIRASLVRIRNGIPIDIQYLRIRPPAAAESRFQEASYTAERAMKSRWLQYANRELPDPSDQHLSEADLARITAHEEAFERDIASAPRWRETLPEILTFIGSDVVTVHSARHNDLCVLKKACDYDNLEWPPLRYICTRVLAEEALALDNYKQHTVAEACGVQIGFKNQSSFPPACALRTAGIACSLAQESGVDSIDELAQHYGVDLGRLGPNLDTPCTGGWWW